MIRRKWKLFNGKRNDSGQTLVESALCFLMFFTLVFGVIDFAWVYYAKATLQNAVRQAARYAVTGSCNTPPCFQNGSGNRLNTIISTVNTFSFALGPTVTVTCTGACPGYSGDGGTNNGGGPGDIVTVTAHYTFKPWLLGRLFPSGGYVINVTSTFKNESFAPPPPS